jgi:hypothetical protein
MEINRGCENIKFPAIKGRQEVDAGTRTTYFSFMNQAEYLLTEKLENLYPGGYIINAVSKPELLMKHLAYEAYHRSEVHEAGFLQVMGRGKDGATPDEVWGRVTSGGTGREGSRSQKVDVIAGVDTKKVLGIFTKTEPVVVKTTNYDMDYVFGRKVKWGFMADEFGQVYTPGFLHTEKEGEVRGMIDAAIARATQEDPSFACGGVNNRLPPEVERRVNPAHFAMLRLRRDKESLLPKIPGLSAQLNTVGTSIGGAAVDRENSSGLGQA